MMQSVTSRFGSSLAQSILQRVQSQLANVQADTGVRSSQSTTTAPASVQPQSEFQRDYYSDNFASEPTSAVGASGSPQSSAANPDAVAQQIAQEAAGWNYDHSGGKTWGQTMSNENTFDGSKSGVCADMALEAAQRFEASGVEARVAYGTTDRGNHAWVEYKGADGQWKMFDPTAAACSKDPSAAITPTDNGMYGYGSAFEHYEAPAES
ncbi:MAG TPA: transglutaminase-like domain-containing protein [Archangium sp.]|jgi:transglutaminase-like putative cysteine protease|uniref:transglutaminase-like domain-containing protein n=1 Tax=Archangium sp. TaxID=1872627 RepID=UPI002EDBB27C